MAGETIAIDRTISKAHNSKKANFSKKKIDMHLAVIEEKIKEYLIDLKQDDTQEISNKIANIQAKIERLKTKKIN